MSGYQQRNDRRAPRKPEDPIRDSVVSNERIRHHEVRLMDEEGNPLGIVPTRQALWEARNRGLDLIEIAANASPPVARIADLNKWVYRLRVVKKEQERKARENAVVTKEIQLRPVTDRHDIEVKQNHAKGFLADSNKVKVVIKFRGRELSFVQRGYEIMDSFITGLGPCRIEKAPEMNGRVLMAILAPALKKT